MGVREAVLGQQLGWTNEIAVVQTIYWEKHGLIPNRDMDCLHHDCV
jgi:hypothetical protein